MPKRLKSTALYSPKCSRSDQGKNLFLIVTAPEGRPLKKVVKVKHKKSLPPAALTHSAVASIKQKISQVRLRQRWL